MKSFYIFYFFHIFFFYSIFHLEYNNYFKYFFLIKLHWVKNILTTTSKQTKHCDGKLKEKKIMSRSRRKSLHRWKIIKRKREFDWSLFFYNMKGKTLDKIIFIFLFLHVSENKKKEQSIVAIAISEIKWKLLKKRAKCNMRTLKILFGKISIVLFHFII